MKDQAAFQCREQKRVYGSASSTDKGINIEDTEVYENMKKSDHSLLVYLLAKEGREDEAIEILKLKKTRFSIARIKEAVYMCIKKGMYIEAVSYIRAFKDKIPEIIPLECMIKIHLERNSENINTIVVNNVTQGLESCYDRGLLDTFKEFYLASDNKLDLRYAFDLIDDIIMRNHYKKLSYNDSKYLFKLMPNKGMYLKRMVQLNPLIKRKYYFMYANSFGILEEDIKRILAAKYRSWAMCIAMFYGWVDESARISFEQRQGEAPLLLNMDGEWDRNFSDVVSFSRKLG